MTLKNKNPWKYLSVGLLGVIAIGLFAPVQAAPGGAQNGWQAVADGLQDQIDNLNINDADSDPTNEIQTLSETTPGVISLSDDGSVTVQDRVSGTCAVGSSISAIAADGTVTCETDDDTKYTAGTGLILTGTQFKANTAELQKRVSGTCPVGESIRVIDGSGGVTCEVDTDTNTTYDETDFATSNQSCAAGMVVTGVDVNGAVTCATDKDTDTKLEIKIFRKTFASTASTSISETVPCPANWSPLGGGYSNTVLDTISQNSHQSISSGISGWKVSGHTASGIADSNGWVYVHCANTPVNFTNLP